MDFQKLIDTMNETSRMERSNYHVTLGELIEFVDKLPLLTIIKIDDGGSPSDPHSYRGYYSDLSFQALGEKINAEKFAKILKGANGNTFEGYKGGDYIMEENTPLWIASYGCTGKAIVAVNEADGELTLITKDLDS